MGCFCSKIDPYNDEMEIPLYPKHGIDIERVDYNYQDTNTKEYNDTLALAYLFSVI